MGRLEKSGIIFLSIVLIGTGVKASEKYLGKLFGGNDDGCPEEMVFVGSDNGGFCIDRYEDSAGSGCFSATPSSQLETRRNLEKPGCQPVSVSGNVPWTNISRDQAENACALAGKRLATSREWHLAAMGTIDVSGKPTADDCQTAGNWPSQPGAAGSGKRCVSAIGAYDMIGNVWEWTAGSVIDGRIGDRVLPQPGYVIGFDDGLPAETDQNEPDENYGKDFFWMKETGTRGIAHGGYWASKTDAGQYAAYITNKPSEAAAGIGFRCVK